MWGGSEQATADIEKDGIILISQQNHKYAKEIHSRLRHILWRNDSKDHRLV